MRGKYARGSYLPPAEPGLATCSRHVNAFKKCSQLGRRPELRNGFEFLESRGKRVRQAPHSPRRELLVLGIDVAMVHHSGQVLGHLKFRPLGQSPEDDLLLQVQGIVAEYEQAKIMERSRRGKKHAARRGSLNVMSCAPFGYRYVSVHDGGGQARFDPIPEQARLVKQVFEWTAQDRCSLGEVCRRLQEAGERTQSGKSIWSRQAVWHILQNPAYYGKIPL